VFFTIILGKNPFYNFLCVDPKIFRKEPILNLLCVLAKIFRKKPILNFFLVLWKIDYYYFLIPNFFILAENEPP
jgi:hypothetical protein